MTVEKSPRLGLTRWGDDSDPWNREDFDEDNAQLDASVVKFAAGTLADRPAASDATAHMVYHRRETVGTTAKSELYYCDGLVWRRLAAFDGPDAIPVDDSGYVSSSSSSFVTAATGWRVDGYTFRRRNAMVHLSIIATRTGDPIASGSNGNIGNVKICTVTDARFIPYITAGLISTATGPIIGAYITVTGDVYLSGLVPNAALATNEQIAFSNTYMGK